MVFFALFGVFVSADAAATSEFDWIYFSVCAREADAGSNSSIGQMNIDINASGTIERLAARHARMFDNLQPASKRPADRSHHLWESLMQARLQRNDFLGL
jgi:hypothetical protein